MGAAIDRISWPVALALAVLIGLAPFIPEPHIVQKLKMLAAGDPGGAADIFDLVFHAAPWALLVAKGFRLVVPGGPAR
jgi:hypothetical protein